jgi:hypothetical protein
VGPECKSENEIQSFFEQNQVRFYVSITNKNVDFTNVLFPINDVLNYDFVDVALADDP